MVKPSLIYVRGPCINCGAVDEVEAETKCRPVTDQTGEWYCDADFDAEGFSIIPTEESLKALDAYYDAMAGDMGL